MQRFDNIFIQEWYVTLSKWQKELVRTSVELYAREERMKSEFDDYSFFVFPMAKAYEGFLKKYLFEIGFISETMYRSKHFRIGRALNPDLSPNRQDEEWVYGRLRETCGEEVGRLIWNTWLECRNQVFHYFPDNQKKLSLLEAGHCLEMMAGAMERATNCRLE